MREKTHEYEFGLNWIQFFGYQFYETIFINNGKSSNNHITIPFPAFKKVLLKLLVIRNLRNVVT